MSCYIYSKLRNPVQSLVSYNPKVNDATVIIVQYSNQQVQLIAAPHAGYKFPKPFNSASIFLSILLVN